MSRRVGHNAHFSDNAAASEDLESIRVITDDDTLMINGNHQGGSISKENSFKRRAVSEDPSVLSNESGISSQIEYDDDYGLEEEEGEEEEEQQQRQEDDDEESRQLDHGDDNQTIYLSSFQGETKGGGIVNLGRKLGFD